MKFWHSFYIIFILILISCNENHFIRIDMSKEHDNGYFQPEKGDRIGLAGNFNNWRADTLFLTDENGDWIFSIPVADVANKEDTLQFKFKIQSGEKRIAANSGWEGISNRKIAVSDLIKDTPVFVYNEVYDKKETIEITFTVGTSNQQLLGFFLSSGRRSNGG
jgi:hypothetical protein